MTNTIDVAWIGVLLATIAGFTLNMIWFSPKVFYTRWQRALGRSEPPTGDASGMGPAFGSVLLALIVQAVSVDWLLQAAAALYGHELSAVSGFLIGAGAGVGFARTDLLRPHRAIVDPRLRSSGLRRPRRPRTRCGADVPRSAERRR